MPYSWAYCMKISGGRARGVRLECPAKGTRPATDALREALFSSLGQVIDDASVLDLFSGTGAYGLEALSRGARHASFVEQHVQAVRCLNNNLKAGCKSAGLIGTKVARVTKADVLKWLKAPQVRFDVIIADPPYDLLKTFCAQCEGLIASHLSRDGVFILEAPANFEVPEFPGLVLRKRLGKKKSQSPSLLIYDDAREAL